MDDDQRHLLLWAYDPEAPSFRHRLRHLMPLLENHGWRCNAERLPKGRYVRRMIERRQQLRSATVLVLSKIKLTPAEGLLLRRWTRRVVVDFDDAIHIRRPRAPGLPPERSWLRRFKFDYTCGLADLVVAGNVVLAAEASHRASSVTVVPTPVALGAYPDPRNLSRQPHTLVWIGMPENLTYLELIRPALVRLTPRYPDLRLRVVSSAAPQWPDVPVEAVPWSEATEVEALSTSGIGLMPLSDDEWTRGKCAFKLLQYMAAGLPCVASPVGANHDAVVEGVTGLLAGDAGAWEQALQTLLEAPNRARALGSAGRERVRQHFDRQVIGPRMVELLEGVASSPSR
jgi:glycosyltransferase involved in cell wall biosynthesis